MHGKEPNRSVGMLGSETAARARSRPLSVVRSSVMVNRMTSQPGGAVLPMRLLELVQNSTTRMRGAVKPGTTERETAAVRCAPPTSQLGAAVAVHETTRMARHARAGVSRGMQSGTETLRGHHTPGAGKQEQASATHGYRCLKFHRNRSPDNM